MRRRYTRDDALVYMQPHVSTDEMRQKLSGLSPQIVESVLQQREKDLEFIRNCSPDLICMLPVIGHKEEMISFWCSVECKFRWGKLQSPRYWWFESEDDAGSFSKAWCTPGSGPGRAWRRKHGVA